MSVILDLPELNCEHGLLLLPGGELTQQASFTVNMQKALILFIFLFISVFDVDAQEFEGKIVYDNVYRSKLPNVADEQLTAMLGSSQDYLIKDGNYKSITNDTMMQWQLYRSEENKLYMKMSGVPVIFWSDGAENRDSIIRTEIRKGAETILGHTCDELILTCKSGVQKYYFSRKIKLDPKVFVQHKFGNFNEVVSHTKAIPLKIIIETPQFSLTSTVTQILPSKLEQKEFELPQGSQLQKSPY